MKFSELNENNYVIFAIKNYENPHAVTKEDFEEDLKRFKWIKRLLKRYKTTGVLKAHLLINHFIILYNSSTSSIDLNIFSNNLIFFPARKFACE